MKRDINIGFERKLDGLESFLEKQGYIFLPNQSNDNHQVYEHKERRWPEVCYYCPVLKVEECEPPDWKKSGYNVVSELEIIFPVEDSKATDEADRLFKELVLKFNGILYDSDLNDFLRKDDL